MKKLAILLVCVFFAACSTAKSNNASSSSLQPNETKDVAIAKKDTSDAAETNPLKSSATDTANTAAASEAQSLIVKSIYFDFDKFVVKPEYRDIVAHEVEILRNHKNVVVTVEGNADERGSSEYNLALGDKRANAVKKSLELLGMSASRINVVSYGETKPKLTCHEEKCWHENRRVDFNLKHG